jgi:hypothetical protein
MTPRITFAGIWNIQWNSTAGFFLCIIVLRVQGFGLQEADCGRGLKAIVCSIVVFGLSSLEGDMKNRRMKEIQVAFDGY